MIESEKGQSYDGSTRQLFNTSKDYIDNHVDKECHPALSNLGLVYSPKRDCFAETEESFCENDTLFSCQQRFAKALQEYEDNVDPRYRTGFDLQNTYTWDDVLKQVEIARNEYNGVGKEGYITSMRNRLRNFSNAAPAVQGWLKLLPGDSVYSSVFCGGLGLILGAAIRLGKLRKDTFDTLDQIPLQIEKAEMLIRMYGANMDEQIAELYKSILDVLQHILSWFKREAGLKFFASFCKGQAYANLLRAKMEAVEKASEVLGNTADLGMHLRLEKIHEVTLATKNQTNALQKEQKELKKLALDARNHLYMIFRDADLRQEFMQNLVALENSTKTSSKVDQRAPFARRERNRLLQQLGHDQELLMRDAEDALHELNVFRHSDQNRVAAIIEHAAVQDWLLELESQALLVHGNCRRDERLSPTSTATAMLIRELFDRFSGKGSKVALLYWFCGSHIDGAHSNILGLVRSFICQLLSLSFTFDLRHYDKINDATLEDLLNLLLDLFRQLPDGTVLVCFVDGISFYEGSQQRDDTYMVIAEIARMVKLEHVILKILMTSPIRTRSILEDPKIAKRFKLVEVPSHIDGPRHDYAASSPC